MKKAIVAVVVLAWVAITAARVHVYGDERLVWMEAVQQAPLKPRPWINLGRQFALVGADHIAEQYYGRAMSLATARPELERQRSITLAQANVQRLSVDLLAWLAYTD